MALHVLFFPDLIAPGLESLEPFFLPTHAAPVDPERCARQFTQKGTVVADHHKSGAGRFQLALKPLHRLDIKMVGRLVQQHEVRCPRHQPGQRRTPPLPARGG